jgi:hypothetical protein
MKGENRGVERRRSSGGEINKNGGVLQFYRILLDFVSVYKLHQPYFWAPSKGVKKDGLGSVFLGSTTLGPPGNDEEKVSQLNATKMKALINLCNKRSTHSIVLFSLFFVLY